MAREQSSIQSVLLSISVMALQFILETFRATHTNKLSILSLLWSLSSDIVAQQVNVICLFTRLG